MITANSHQLLRAYEAESAFCGLGFDLQPVKALAACFTLIRIKAPDTLIPGLPRIEPVAAPAGFERMLLLGCETRGR